MNELLVKQSQLHTSATTLLQEILLPILEKYGKVSVGGSYAYKLLSHPDLDIDVVSENLTKELFGKLCKELLSLNETSKFKSADRVNFPHTTPGNKPTGYWISPEINFEENVWTLDIWLQKPEMYTGNTNRYEKELQSIDDEKRIAILSLKDELRNKKLYGVGKEFLSVDVYEGVLRGNVRTVDELRNFISSRS